MNATVSSTVLSPLVSALWCLLLSAFLLVGCASQYPLGLTKEQWDALPPAQQAEYRARQTALDEQRRQEAAARRASLQAEAENRERLKQERVQAAYANARYGDVITVLIQDGEMVFFGKRHAYEPVSFDLVRGESREIEFSQKGMAMVKVSATASLSTDGNTFTLEDTQLNRTVLVNDAWENGKTYTASSGMTVRIRYRDLAGAPFKIKINN